MRVPRRPTPPLRRRRHDQPEAIQPEVTQPEPPPEPTPETTPEPVPSNLESPEPVTDASHEGT
jgi:hypothetical protein